MTSLTHTTEIARPVGEVFRFVANPENDPLWCPRVVWCRQRGGDGPGLGARYEAFHRPTLQRRHSRWIDVIEYEAPSRVVSRQTDEVGVFTITYEFGPADDQRTRLTQSDEIEWRVLRPAVPLAKRIVDKHMADQLRRLRGCLETTEGSSLT